MSDIAHNDFIQKINKETAVHSETVTSPLCGVTDDSTIFYSYEGGEIIAKNLYYEGGNGEWDERVFEVKRCQQIVPYANYLLAIQELPLPSECGSDLYIFDLTNGDTFHFALQFMPSLVSNLVVDSNGILKCIIKDSMDNFRYIQLNLNNSRILPTILDIDFPNVCPFYGTNEVTDTEVEIHYSNSIVAPFELTTKFNSIQPKYIFFNNKDVITFAFSNGFISRFTFQHNDIKNELLLSGFIAEGFQVVQLVESLSGFMIVLDSETKGTIIGFYGTDEQSKIIYKKYLRLPQRSINALLVHSINENYFNYAIQMYMVKPRDLKDTEGKISNHAIQTYVFDLEGNKIKETSPLVLEIKGEYIKTLTDQVTFMETFEGYNTFEGNQMLIPSHPVCILVHDYNEAKTTVIETQITTERFEKYHREINCLSSLLIKKKDSIKLEDLSFHNIYYKLFGLPEFEYLRTDYGIKKGMDIIFNFDIFDVFIDEIKINIEKKDVDLDAINFVSQSVIDAYVTHTANLPSMINALRNESTTLIAESLNKLKKVYSQILKYFEVVGLTEHYDSVKRKLRSIDTFKPFIASKYQIDFDVPIKYMPTIVTLMNVKVFKTNKFTINLFDAFLYSLENDVSLGVLYYLYVLAFFARVLTFSEINNVFLLSLTDGDRIMYEDGRFTEEEIEGLMAKASNRFLFIKKMFDKFFAIDNSCSLFYSITSELDNLLVRNCVEQVANAFSDYCQNQMILPTIINQQNGFSRSTLRRRPSEVIQRETEDDEIIDRMKNFFTCGLHNFVNTENGIKSVISCGIYLRKFKDVFAVIKKFVNKPSYTQNDIDNLVDIIPLDFCKQIPLDTASPNKFKLASKLVFILFKESFKLQRIVECYEAVKTTMWRELLVYKTLMSQNEQHILSLCSILMNDQSATNVKNVVFMYLTCTIDVFKDEEDTFNIVQNEFTKYGKNFSKEISYLLQNKEETYNKLKEEYKELWKQKIKRFILHY